VTTLATADGPPMFLPHEVHVYPHGRHGIGLAAGEGAAEGWTAACAAWLDAPLPTIATSSHHPSIHTEATT
jgi:hypothetical protein